jgi:hypothetical protein
VVAKRGVHSVDGLAAVSLRETRVGEAGYFIRIPQTDATLALALVI